MIQENAIATLDTASARDSSNYIFPYTKGLIYQKTEQYRKAIAAYKRSAELAPEDSKIYTNIGTCYYNIGVDIQKHARSITNNRAFLEEQAKAETERSGWIIKFENKARKNYKPQYTKVFEDLEFLQ